MPESHTLDRGTLLVVESAENVPLVSLVIALRTGPAHDPPGRLGLARIALRMLRRGTTRHSSQEIDRRIDLLGAELGVDTSSTSIAMHGQVISRNFGAFIDLLADLLANPSVDLAELERLKRETIAEITESLDSDRSLVQRAFSRGFFGDHPYGRPGNGTLATVANITQEDVKQYYATHLVHGNVIIGLSGDVTSAQGLAAARTLSDALRTGSPLGDRVGDPPMPNGRTVWFVDKPERTQSQIVVGTLGTSARDADHHALVVANAIFGGTFTSRLMREVRSKRGWSYGAGARLSLERSRHAFAMSTAPGMNDTGPCLALMLNLYEAWVDKGVTPRETRFIQKYLVRSQAFEEDTAAKRLHLAVDVELLGLPADYYRNYRSAISAVTPDAASEAVKKRLSTDHLVIAISGTASDTLDAVNLAVPNLAATHVLPYAALG